MVPVGRATIPPCGLCRRWFCVTWSEDSVSTVNRRQGRQAKQYPIIGVMLSSHQAATGQALCHSPCQQSRLPKVACICMPCSAAMPSTWKSSSYKGSASVSRRRDPNLANSTVQWQQCQCLHVCAVMPEAAADCPTATAFMLRFNQDNLSKAHAVLTDRYQQDIDVFAELVQELQCLVQQGVLLPAAYMDRLCSYLRPLPDGAFLFDFLDLLLCFHVMGYTPHTTWLQQLDDAVLDCCSDPSSVTAPFPLGSQHAVAFMSLLCADAERGLDACRAQQNIGMPFQACCVMAFPLLLESRLKGTHQQLGNHTAKLGPVAEQLGVQLDRYYSSVMAWYQMEGAAGSRSWWPVQHTLDSLLAARTCLPLFNRLQPAFQHLDAGLDVLEDCMLFQQQCPGLLSPQASAAHEELQQCMCAAMHCVRHQVIAMTQQAQGDVVSVPTKTAYWENVSWRTTHACSAVIHNSLPGIAAGNSIRSEVLQALINLMHSVEMLHQARGGTGTLWDRSDIHVLDTHTADQRDPEILVPVFDMMSRHSDCWLPSAPAMRTPITLLQVLGSDGLVSLGYQQLVLTLQALGRAHQHAAAAAAASAADGDQLSANLLELQGLMQQEYWYCPSECTVRACVSPASEHVLMRMDLYGVLGARLASLLAGMPADKQREALHWLQ